MDNINRGGRSSKRYDDDEGEAAAAEEEEDKDNKDKEESLPSYKEAVEVDSQGKPIISTRLRPGSCEITLVSPSQQDKKGNELLQLFYMHNMCKCNFLILRVTQLLKVKQDKIMRPSVFVLL